ncbi:MAG: hypothetical protein KAU52_05525, partial [Methanosarcinales archaeon]|nr:hypothetical protein [Methanosarcinales archaeon]
DWDDNSGYPSTYDIDGGSNVDERPKGFYDFLTGASDDKWAFKYQVGDNPGAGDPSIEFNTTEYAAIKADDGVSACNTTTTDGRYAAHRFNFSINDSCTCTCINESALEMSVINVTWNGKGWHDSSPESTYDGAYLYIWNGADYEELANNSGDDGWVYLTGEKTSSISSYIISGNVTILVKQKSVDTGRKHSHICTDYVKVVIADP